MNGRKRARLCALALAGMLAIGCEGARSIAGLPDRISLTAGSGAVLDFALPGSAQLDAGSTRAALHQNAQGLEISAGDTGGKASLIFRLLGILPVKRMDVEVSGEKVLIPGGKSVGVAIETEGLVVVGTSDLGKRVSPAQRAGLRAGDVITRVNGQTVRRPEELSAKLRADETSVLTISREGRTRTVELTPLSDSEGGAARIGAWVRSGTAGVGTLTFVDPETNRYGALGHAVADADTGVTLPVADGAIYESRVVQINRGTRGAPGEIVGDFFTDEREIGTVALNTDFGIYGEDYAGDSAELPYPDGLPIGRRSEMHTGGARILTTIGDHVESFDCEIERVEPEGGAQMRAIVLHITDEDLIARTGGIVQGMSGSPIIQDGKLVGAVTHVFVGDPTRGYGVGIETMLHTMEALDAIPEAA